MVGSFRKFFDPVQTQVGMEGFQVLFPNSCGDLQFVAEVLKYSSQLAMDRQQCAPRQTIFTPQLQLPIAGTRGTRLPPDARLMGRLEQLAEIWRPPVN